MKIKCNKGHTVEVSKACYELAKKTGSPLLIHCPVCDDGEN